MASCSVRLRTYKPRVAEFLYPAFKISYNSATHLIALAPEAMPLWPTKVIQGLFSKGASEYLSSKHAIQIETLDLRSPTYWVMGRWPVEWQCGTALIRGMVACEICLLSSLTFLHRVIWKGIRRDHAAAGHSVPEYRALRHTPPPSHNCLRWLSGLVPILLHSPLTLCSDH